MAKTFYRVGTVTARDARTGRFSSVMKQSGASNRTVVTISKEAYEKGREAAASSSDRLKADRRIDDKVRG